MMDTVFSCSPVGDNDIRRFHRAVDADDQVHFNVGRVARAGDEVDA